MNEITQLLYWISTGLLIPVIILLLFFFLRAMLLIGSFYSIYIQKMKFNRSFKSRLDELDASNIRTSLKDYNKYKLIFTVFLNKLTNGNSGKIYYDKVLNDFEIECEKDVALSQTLAKLGPILGLMGTLIPMGPALVGLASGDIASMATNMQVAFATTVIGLLTGAVGFIILQVKRRWNAADMNNLEYIAELLIESKESQLVCKSEQSTSKVLAI